MSVDVKPNVLPVPDSGLSVTFKGGAGFDSPWIVPKYSSVTEALLDLGVSEDDVKSFSPAQAWQALMIRVQAMAKSFIGHKPVSEVASAAAPAASPSAPPAGAAQAPGGQTRQCKHGEMQFRSGVARSSGKPWSAFMCPTPKGTPDQCEAEWLR